MNHDLDRVEVFEGRAEWICNCGERKTIIGSEHDAKMAHEAHKMTEGE